VNFYTFAGDHPILTVILGMLCVSAIGAAASAFRPVCRCQKDDADG